MLCLKRISNNWVNVHSQSFYFKSIWKHVSLYVKRFTFYRKFKIKKSKDHGKRKKQTLKKTTHGGTTHNFIPGRRGGGVIGAGPSQQTPKYLQGFPLCGEHGAPIFKGEMYKRSFDHVILKGNISQNRIKLLNFCKNAFIMVILIKDLINFWAINLPYSVLPPPPSRKIQKFHSPIFLLFFV